MTVVFEQKKARQTRKAFAIMAAVLSVLFAEGLRAALITHLTGETPKLLGFVPTSPIDAKIALHFVMPIASIGLLGFLWFLFAMIWKGVLYQVSIEGTAVKTWYNGFGNKSYTYDLNQIRKLTFKTVSTSLPGSSPAGSPSTPGTTVISELIFISYEMKNGRIKKIELVSGDKKPIRALGKRLKEEIAKSQAS